MTAINNIPSVSDFKKSVGRYYIVERMRKKKDTKMYAIFRALEGVQPIRNVVSAGAHQRMRILRKACADWLYPPMFYEDPDEPTVKKLAENVHHRILDIVTQLHSGSNGLLRDLARREIGLARDRAMMLNDSGVQIGRPVGENYNVERFTGSHLPGTCRGEYGNYLSRFPASNLGAEDFVNLIINPLRADDPHKMIGGNIVHDKRVMYCNARERRRYKLSLEGDGLLRRVDGALLDTSGMQSITTGAGWGIFVVDMNQDFYVHAHAVDQFHHSSFLAGEPVFSAGEVCVSDGVLVGVTNKTGHYKSGAAELYRALVLLQKHIPKKGWRGGIGAGMERVAVCDPFAGGGDMWRSGEDTIAAGGDFKNAKLLNAQSMTKPTAKNMASLAESVKPLLVF